MKGFESAYSLFAGFNFANAESRENALWLLHWLHQAKRGEPQRPPMVVIQGPTATGKTTLINRLTDLAQVHVHDGWELTDLTVAARREDGALVIEGDWVLEKKAMKDLCNWLTASRWEYRKLRSKERIETPPLCTVTVWLRPDGEPMPAELERRSIFIRLLARD